MILECDSCEDLYIKCLHFEKQFNGKNFIRKTETEKTFHTISKVTQNMPTQIWLCDRGMDSFLTISSKIRES